MEMERGQCRRLTALLLAVQDDPSFPTPYRYLAACYAHMGRLADAKQVVARLRSITSAVVSGADCFCNPEQREFYLSACAWPQVRL
jgi:adenylate cyclase